MRAFIKKAALHSNTGIANSHKLSANYTDKDVNSLAVWALAAFIAWNISIITSVFFISRFVSGWWQL